MNLPLRLLVIAKTDGRSNYAAQHLAAAEYFADELARIERDTPPDPAQLAPPAYIHCCFAAYVFSAMALEANVYDYMTLAERGEASALGSRRFGTKDHRLPVLERYKLVYSAVLPAETLNLGSGTAQDVRSLILLRDEIVHAKTEWHSAPEVSRRLQTQLGPRFPHNPYLGGDQFFPGQCVSLAAARWAISAVRAFATEFSDKTNLPRNIANAA